MKYTALMKKANEGRLEINAWCGNGATQLADVTFYKGMEIHRRETIRVTHIPLMMDEDAADEDAAAAAAEAKAYGSGRAAHQSRRQRPRRVAAATKADDAAALAAKAKAEWKYQQNFLYGKGRAVDGAASDNFLNEIG